MPTSVLRMVDVMRSELADLPRQRRTPGPISRSTPEHQLPPMSPPTRRSPPGALRLATSPPTEGSNPGRSPPRSPLRSPRRSPLRVPHQQEGHGTRHFRLRGPLWRDRHDVRRFIAIEQGRTARNSTNHPRRKIAARDRVMGVIGKHRGGARPQRRCYRTRRLEQQNVPYLWSQGQRLHTYGARANGRVSLGQTRLGGRARCPSRGRRPRSEGR